LRLSIIFRSIPRFARPEKMLTPAMKQHPLTILTEGAYPL